MGNGKWQWVRVWVRVRVSARVGHIAMVGAGAEGKEVLV